MKLNNKIFIVVIIIISIVMGIKINQKEGFHEDEMFSYGSSNYKYDNVYQQFGKSDSVNVFVKEKIMADNLIETIRNIKYYDIEHVEEKDEFIQKTQREDYPIWRTRQEAKEYLTIGKEDILNYAMVYYNQARDVHPPLFYFLVHTISIFFYGNFSKYIIFIINLGFLIASCFVIKSIMKQLNKEYLSNIVILLYGLSMGAISTVMFQRMYMMLTFFVLLYLLINLKIVKNNYKIDKGIWIQLGIITICGFLTQYYFCIIAFIIAFVIFIKILKTRDKELIKKYILNYVKIAGIGIILFPMSINDIFFSYRGVPSFTEGANYIEKLTKYANLISYSFSIPIGIAIIAIILIIGLTVYKLVKEKNKKIIEISILTLPIIIYILIIAKIAPDMEYKYAIRYIMCILPLISIDIVLMIDKICKNQKQSIVIITLITLGISTYGFITSESMYMLKGYKNYLEIAEKYKEDNFVFIGNTVFNQIQNMQEFMIYKQSLIINENQLDYLINNKELEQSKEFILSIKKYLGADKLLEEALKKSGYSNYEILLDDSGDVGCVIYKITK